MLVTNETLHKSVETLSGTINALQADLAGVQDELDEKTEEVEKLKVDLYVAREGLGGAIKLKNIEIARLKKDYAFSQYNYAGALMRLADIELAAAEKASQCPSS